MIYSDYIYVDTAIGSVTKRNNVQDITKLPNYSGQSECYRTVFRFNKSYLIHFQETSSVSGYRGKCYGDWIPIDIDSENLEEAYTKAKSVIDILRMDFDYDVHYLFFSSRKGFHILLPAQNFGIFEPSENLPEIFKCIISDICKEYADLAIYEINRIFRMVNTRNEKSNLFKIPLTIQDFYKGLDFITELAKTTQESQFYQMSESILNQQLKELYVKYKSGNIIKESDNQPDKKINKIFQILQGVKEGERDSSATSLAGLFKSKGFDKDFTVEFLNLWNKHNNPPLTCEQIEKVINSIFKYEEANIKNIYPVWALYDEYKEYISKEKQVNLGIPIIDDAIRGLRPGQVLTLMGFTGNLKSAVLQKILQHVYQYTKEPVIEFQLEMSRLDLFERAVQMEMKLTNCQVEEMFKQSDQLDKENVQGLLKERLEHVYFVDKAGLNFSDITNYLKLAEEKIYRKKTGLVGIDFIQLMSGKGVTEVQIISDVAKEAKEFAKNMNVPVILVSQISNVESAEDEIKLMDARYSKTIAHMGDFVLGIWIKPIPNDNKIKQIISVLKNRKGGLITVSRIVDPSKFIFEQPELYQKELPKKNYFKGNNKNEPNVKDITQSKNETDPF